MRYRSGLDARRELTDLIETYGIHHNARHWWGTPQDWQIVQDSFTELKEYVEARWNTQEQATTVHRPENVGADCAESAASTDMLARVRAFRGLDGGSGPWLRRYRR